MKADNTIQMIGRIREGANQIIVSELEKRGHKGLAPSHGDILVTLLFEGEMTKSEIAQRIKRGQSTVTTLINKLEKLGYIVSRTNEGDGRSKIVSLTDKGHLIRKDMVEISELLYGIQYQGLSQDEVKVLRKALGVMVSNFMGGQ